MSASSARKKAEQRRLDRHKQNVLAAFNRKAEDRRALAAKTEQQKAAEAAKSAEQAQGTKADQQRREAEAYVAEQHKRQEAEQREEHRRQTHRLRVEHQAERTGFRHREAGLVIQHARQIRNIDVDERRDLDALDARRHSPTGRAVRLVRGSKHYDRQERAIVERHENARWQKHREHEGKKDGLFQAEQASRLRQVADRHGIAQRHQGERSELGRAQERSRPQLVEARAQALAFANENRKPRQKEQAQERPVAAFTRAAERSR